MLSLFYFGKRRPKPDAHMLSWRDGTEFYFSEDKCVAVSAHHPDHGRPICHRLPDARIPGGMKHLKLMNIRDFTIVDHLPCFFLVKGDENDESDEL